MLEELVERSRYVVAVFENDAVDAFLAQIVSGNRFPIHNLAFGFKVGTVFELASLVLNKVAYFGLAPSEQLADLLGSRAAVEYQGTPHCYKGVIFRLVNNRIKTIFFFKFLVSLLIGV